MPPRSRTLAALLIALVAALPGRIAHAEPEPFRLTFTGAFQAERLNAPYADSLGVTMTHGNRAGLEFDFRVLEAPMPGAERPALHVTGGATTTRRAVAILGLSGVPAGVTPMRETSVSEMGLGMVFSVPLSMVSPTGGVSFYAGYQGAVVLAGSTSQDFLHLKQAVFGFERTRGLFDGTLVEMAYGVNESWGPDAASGRWAGRCRIAALLGPGPRGGGKAPLTMGSPIRAFVELAVDTDGGPGPDDIRAQAGLAIDAGNVLLRAMGSK